MKKMIRLYTLCGILVCCANAVCGQQTVQKTGTARAADSTRTDSFLVTLLSNHGSGFDPVFAKNNRLQLIYTTIDRGANGIAGLKQYYFNVNPAEYSYPATAVKLPVAILTLQQLAALKVNGVDRSTTMLTEKDYSGQTAVYNEPSVAGGRPSVDIHFKKMMLVNDEDGYNRLYELLGQSYIHQQLQQRGYAAMQIRERLGVTLTDDENRHTNPVTFMGPATTVIYKQPGQFSAIAFDKRHDTVKGIDFSVRNRASLEDLHQMLISIIFPNKVTASKRFALTDDDRRYLLKYMSAWPSENVVPPYADDAAYSAAYTKFLLYGGNTDSIPEHVRIFNTSGEAYGMITDAAYVVDFDKKVEFFLSASLTCADEKEAATVGMPFMKKLGELIYQYEIKRAKQHLPDLGDLQLTYDGR